MARVLSKSDEQFIRDNYLKFSSRKIGDRLGHPRGTIASFLKREGLSIPDDLKMKWRLEAVQEKYNSIVHPEDELIKELYLLMPQKTLAELIGRSDTFLYGRMKKLGLEVPEELIKEWIELSRIKPGSVPVNKGKKQEEYMSKEAIERTKLTRFKKGEPNHNELFDGAITIRWNHQERGEQPHWYIRLSKGIWKELQIFEWERVNGPIPKKHVLACIDGDTLNVHPDNWVLLSMAENAKRNAGHKNLPDSYVAYCLAGRKNKHLKDVYLKHPELIELKRDSLILNRTINEQRRTSTTDYRNS
jgi:hypothetical protein